MLSNRHYFAHFLGEEISDVVSFLPHCCWPVKPSVSSKASLCWSRDIQKTTQFFSLQCFFLDGLPPVRRWQKIIWFYIDFHSFPWFFLWQNVTSSEAQYLNVGGTMSQSQGTSHPSRWKLQCSQYDFPYEMEYYGKSQWLCPSSIFPLEFLHLQDKLCGQTVTYLISLHVSAQGFYLMMILMNILMVMVVIGDF